MFCSIIASCFPMHHKQQECSTCIDSSCDHCSYTNWRPFPSVAVSCIWHCGQNTCKAMKPGFLLNSNNDAENVGRPRVAESGCGSLSDGETDSSQSSWIMVDESPGASPCAPSGSWPPEVTTVMQAMQIPRTWTQEDTQWLHRIFHSDVVELSGQPSAEEQLIQTIEDHSEWCPDESTSSGFLFLPPPPGVAAFPRELRWRSVKARASVTLHLWYLQCTDRPRMPPCGWCGFPTGNYCDQCSTDWQKAAMPLCQTCENMGIESCRKCCAASATCHPSAHYNLDSDAGMQR
jgi:hypothetical protein